MAVTPTDDLLERLKDPEYAKLYGTENAKVDFAATLTKARKSFNLTQKNLADKLGISQPYVAKLESGEANPTLDRIGSMLAA
ncbi:MAG: helix-turn-helix domain-containing protein, partial [Proteobacteria bacterium]|nr:helix-turn-helix domain-containing protein [Pseudomonadota bacterium]